MSRTDEEKANDYAAMGDSVMMINAIIDGTINADRSLEDRKERVRRNVDHLSAMVALTDWGDEDMTAVNAAITAGQTYRGSSE
jgi:hypothetical protein